MEGLMEKQICSPNTTPSPLAMHKNSQTISKVKPKIRIIHIFAPEIIKTDAANFRELVQRLTGKPTDDQNNCCAKKKPRISRNKEQRIFTSNKKMELAMRAGFHAGSAGFRERIKGEEEIWRGANSGGGFLGGFAEFEGFMQEINQFPFLEGTTQIDAYGESQLA
ncbi:hypothetical protein Pfo_029450 [Paulownia fortunei]|nr:hypothetical protein Pfo_029450 [Paulownia fortunei]